MKTSYIVTLLILFFVQQYIYMYSIDHRSETKDDK